MKEFLVWCFLVLWFSPLIDIISVRYYYSMSDNYDARFYRFTKNKKS